MATVYNTLGSEVTIIELMNDVLPMLDKEISKAAEKAYAKQGMKILTGSQVTSTEKKGDGIELIVKTPSGEEKFSFDKVLVSVGMTPNTKKLNLDNVGVETDKKGFIPTDKRMRTNVSNIYAIGDITGGMLLAHKASHEGIVAVEAIAGSNIGADWKAFDRKRGRDGGQES
jgi:dihydrolipoamide dehydrogenase